MSKRGDWQECLFYDKIELNHKVKLNKGGVYPFIDMPSVGVGVRAPEQVRLKEYSGSGVKFKRNDTLIARIEPCTQNGKRFYFREGEVGFGSTEFIVFSPKDASVDPLFLFYFMKQEHIHRRFVASMTGTSGRRRVDTSFLSKYSVKMPDVETQRNIADILSSLDDKIEHNDRLIKLLEERVRASYNYWFVQFDFPDANGNPYRSNGGKMVWSDTLKKEIPAGWHTMQLEKLCERITKGTTPSTLGYAFTDKGVNFVKVESITENHQLDVRQFSYIDATTHEVMARSQLQNGDVLFSIAGSIGRIAMVDSSILPANTNQAVAIIRASKESLSPYYLYAMFMAKGHVPHSQKNIEVSAQANLSLGALGEMEILRESAGVMDAFVQIVKPLILLMQKLCSENRLLIAQRDFLLPRLMTGEITVAD